MSKKFGILIGTAVLVAGGLYFLFDYRGRSAEPDRPGNGGAVQSGEAVTVQPDGLRIEVLKEGSGEGAKAGDTITVHYTGTLTDGRKFDSSRDRGRPFSFELGAGRVIRGWDQGLLGMKIGEQRRLTIPPELGYGSAGAGDAIPPNATLTFEVEMLGIK